MLPGVVLVLALTAALSAPSLDLNWNQWKNKHNKTYDETEEGWRRTVWEKNLKIVEQHNLEHSMGKHTYRLGMNQFGDKPNNMEVPPSVDWRKAGYVTPVKDQGKCTAGWAFSATGAMEGQWFKKTGKLVPLSSQNLIHCSGIQGNDGCNGGLMDQSFQYVMDNPGLDSEVYYSYVGKDQPCRYNTSCNSADINGFVDVPVGSEPALALAVAAVGPISVAVDATQRSFQLYESGIYYDPQCISSSVTHGVLLVGYSYEKPSENYWILKNSWGTNWGESGYIRMAKDRNNQCGVATAASYPVV